MAFTNPSGCSTWCLYVVFEWDAINVTYKGRICFCSLVGPPAAAFGRRMYREWQSGEMASSQCVINLEVTAKRMHFWLRSAVEGLSKFTQEFPINKI